MFGRNKIEERLTRLEDALKIGEGPLSYMGSMHSLDRRLDRLQNIIQSFMGILKLEIVTEPEKTVVRKKEKI